MKIPSFQGKNDPEAYLEWERKVELVFVKPQTPPGMTLHTNNHLHHESTNKILK